MGARQLRIPGGWLPAGVLVVTAVLIPAGLALASARPPESLSLTQGIDVRAVLYDELFANAARPLVRTLAPAATSGLTIRRYEVRDGDTISEIAQRFGVDLDSLISFNNIRRAAELSAGAVLSIPSASGLAYVVRRGDTLSGIAHHHRLPLADILDWNDLDTSVISPGQRLFLPGGRLSENQRNAVLGRLFIQPTRGRITSRYGYRPDPFTGIRRFHNGIDIAAPLGTPIVASMRGRVARVGVNGNYGRYVILVHSDGFQTLYAHLSGTDITAGQVIRQGQTLGTMGSTGYSTGSHLHFSVFKAGEHVDPLSYLQ